VRPFVDEVSFKVGTEDSFVSRRPSDQSFGRGRPSGQRDGYVFLRTRLFSAEYIVANNRSLDRKVYDVPKNIDKEVARLKLASMSMNIDTLTPEQIKYWRAGRKEPDVGRQAA